MGTIHDHPPGVGEPDDRAVFLIDGCPRCAEYARDLGLHFTADRFAAFWRHMIDVEFEHGNDVHYGSRLDDQLGSALFKVALALQRAFGFDKEALRFSSPRLDAEQLAEQITPAV